MRRPTSHYGILSFQLQSAFICVLLDTLIRAFGLENKIWPRFSVWAALPQVSLQQVQTPSLADFCTPLEEGKESVNPAASSAVFIRTKAQPHKAAGEHQGDPEATNASPDLLHTNIQTGSWEQKENAHKASRSP